MRRHGGRGAVRRVLVLPAWYPWPDRPGHGSFCRDHAVAVSGVHDVVVTAWTSDDRLTAPVAISEAIENGLRTFRIRVRASSHPRLETLEKVLALLIVLGRLRLGGWRADVIHVHEYTAGVPAMIAAVVNRAPMVVSEHSSSLALRRLPGSEMAKLAGFFVAPRS